MCAGFITRIPNGILVPPFSYKVQGELLKRMEMFRQCILYYYYYVSYANDVKETACANILLAQSLIVY